MVVLQTNEDGADIRLSGDELDMLNNALNELCNGIHIEDWEFQTRVGWDRRTVRGLLEQIHAAAPNLN